MVDILIYHMNDRRLDGETNKLRARIKNLLDAGFLEGDIADQLQCSVALIQKTRLAYGLKLDTILSRRTVALILAYLMRSERTYEDIAVLCDVAPSTVRDWARVFRQEGFDMPRRSRGRPKKYSPIRKEQNEL
jgi:Helix-turn-helix domain